MEIKRWEEMIGKDATHLYHIIETMPESAHLTVEELSRLSHIPKTRCLRLLRLMDELGLIMIIEETEESEV